MDDEPLALKVLESYISTTPELNLVAKCETLEEAFKALSTNHIDIIFLDLNLKNSFGLEIVDWLKGEMNGRYYVIITSALPRKIDDFRDIFKSHKVILVDFLTKPFSYDRFLTVVKKTLNHKASLND